MNKVQSIANEIHDLPLEDKKELFSMFEDFVNTKEETPYFELTDAEQAELDRRLANRHEALFTTEAVIAALRK